MLLSKVTYKWGTSQAIYHTRASNTCSTAVARLKKQLEGAQQIETDIIFINMKQLKNNAQTVKTMTSVCERTAIVMAGF